MTRFVEGELRVSQYLIFATLAGGADRLDVRSGCGERFKGIDRRGTVSLVPMGCDRRSRAESVCAKWASLAIDAALMERVSSEHASLSGPRSFTTVEDPFLWGLLAELERLHSADGEVDASYGEAVTLGAAHYIHERYLKARSSATPHDAMLSRWQVNKVNEFVAAHLDRPLRIAELAELLQLSDGHFHRAFRATCGLTPLQFIHRERIRRAVELLRAEPRLSTLELALRVGFTSTNFFARTFRRWTGVNPSTYKRGLI